MSQIILPTYKDYFKRIFDFLLSLALVMAFSPVGIVIAVIQLIEYRGRVFFFQERPGKGERPFKIVKFKTMNDQRDQEGNLLPNHLRMTKSGSFLRKYSLDELPQLFNVLTGEMSFVGPRPLLFKYIPLYSSEQKRRHNVRPGITGLAQVNGRNSITWTRKFEFDIYYVDNISFLLDLKIYLLTVKKVLKSEGINANENVTMPPFDGKN